MSHIFQRPLCDMGQAYDYAFRATAGEPLPDSGGGCDDRPSRVELFRAGTEPDRPDAEWRAFSLCPEHAGQLWEVDRRLVRAGQPSRFRSAPVSSGGAGVGR